MFQGKTLLITGGTGTFGNAVLRRHLQSETAEIRIFSRDEKKQDDMRRRWADARIKFHIGDVRNGQGLRDAMAGVDFVFHAAALKQVPSCEFFPIEAVRANVLGAENVLNAAIAAGVRHVVVLSTDKAGYPINAMGISKAMMEKLAVAKSRVAGEATVICCTRYGNVMASRGSVVPHFIRQIQSGEPLTVTDPQMTRFMMSIDGAVDLVLWAFTHGRPGDTFVQKARAATIDTLAQALKRVFSADNPVQIIGTRHGEKLYETLLTREDFAQAEDMGDYYRVAADNRDLNYGLYFDYKLNRVYFDDLDLRPPDHYLGAAGRTAAETIGRVIIAVDRVLGQLKPEAVLILGDTNSCVAALPAKRRRIPVFHMEAGSRCFDVRVPEVINRRIVSEAVALASLAELHKPFGLTDYVRRVVWREQAQAAGRDT